jgi:hypothetical protein
VDKSLALPPQRHASFETRAAPPPHDDGILSIASKTFVILRNPR